MSGPLREAREAAHAAYLDATTLGSDPEDRVDAVVNAVILTLRAHGALSATEDPTSEQLERDARFLATASGFPRYTEDDGWTYLRHYEADVRCAYFKATEHLRPGQEAHALYLALTQQRLLEHLEETAS